MTKIRQPRSHQPKPVEVPPSGPRGANPISEAEARLRVTRHPHAIDRAVQEVLPRFHFIEARRVEHDDSFLGRLMAFLERNDKAVAAAMLGLGALPAQALGAPIVVQPAVDNVNQELGELAQRPSFRALAPETQDAARTEIARHVDDHPARTILGALVQSPGFGSLTPADQVRLLRYVGGTNDEVSTPARWAMGRLLGQDDFRALDPQAQAARLRTFVAEQPGAREVVTRSNEAVNRAAFALGQPTEVPNFAFRAGNADALRYDVEIDGRRVPLWVPKTTDPAVGFFHTAEQLAKGFAALPIQCRELVRELVIEPGRNPEDAYWAGVFHDPTMRAYMTAGDGRVSVYPTGGATSQVQLDGSIIHETGHLLAAKVYGSIHEDGNGDRWTPWRTAMAGDGFWPSNYGHRAMGEDFAESVQLYVQVRGTPQEAELRALFPGRFTILDELLKLPEHPAPKPAP